MVHVRTPQIRGFTMLEFSVVAAIFTVLAGSALSALLYYEELGEKTEVQLTILNIRAGLRYQLAERMMKGRMHELPALSRANPVAWLERPPAGYAGELAGSEAEPLRRGTWYFDTGRSELRYRPRLRNFLGTDQPWLRWRAVPVQASGRDEPESVAFIEVEPQPWF
jgi:general secretion pathway protein G